MKAIRIQLTDEQKKKLSMIEKEINKGFPGRFAVFAQIHFPDGEAAVILVRGEDSKKIHEVLKRNDKGAK